MFADIEPQTFNIDPGSIGKVLSRSNRAIIAVHLFGLSADLAPIMALAKPRAIAVIEDAAQAIGARYQGTRVGGLAAAGCFSFFPSKNLGGIGDGGLITTNDAALAQRIRLLREHGSARKYHYETIGFNSRLDEIQAAVLRVKLNDSTAGPSRAAPRPSVTGTVRAARPASLCPRAAVSRRDTSTFTINSSSAAPGATNCGAFSPGTGYKTFPYRDSHST